MKKVDKLGRIVIPLELREKYGLSEGVRIEFRDDGEGITVRASEPFCRLCKVRISDDAAFPLCENCLMKAAKSYNEKNAKRESEKC